MPDTKTSGRKETSGGVLSMVWCEQLLASRSGSHERGELRQCEQQRQREQQRQQRDEQQWRLPSIFIITVTRYEGEIIKIMRRRTQPSGRDTR